MSAISRGFGLTVLACASLTATTANAAVIFNSLSIGTASYARASRGAVTDQRTISQSKATTSEPNGPVSVTSAASGFVRTGTPAATRIQSNATTTAAANLSASDFGSFDVTSVLSITQAQASTTSAPISGTARGGQYDIQYNFTLTGPRIINLGYNLTDPNFVGMGPVTASVTGGLGAFTTALSHNSSGSLSSLLGSGTYTLRVLSGYSSEINRAGLGIGTTTGSSTDHFDFSLGAVPEPSTWAMMIVGFCVAGSGMRRRNATRVAMRLRYA